MDFAFEDNVCELEQEESRVINIKNTHIDIDSVTCDAGLDYINWTQITKTKLKERDSKLLHVKIIKIEEITNSILSAFAIATNEFKSFKIPQQLINIALNHLNNVIDNDWNGINLSKTKKHPNTFRDYFLLSKNWWYSRKKKLIGTVFWLKILRHLQSVNHFKHHQVLFMRVIKALFDATVSFTNTKPLPLINHGTLIYCKELQQYLLSIHESLNITQIMTQQKDNATCNRGIGPLVTAELRLRLSSAVSGVIQSAPHNDVNVQSTNINSAALCHDTNVLNITQNMPYLLPPTPINNCNMPSNTSYVGNHGAMYTVQGIRSSPLMVKQPVGVIYTLNNSNIVQYGIAYTAVPVSFVTIANQ